MADGFKPAVSPQARATPRDLGAISAAHYDLTVANRACDLGDTSRQDLGVARGVQVETMQSEIWSAPTRSAAPSETPSSRADAEDLLEADPESPSSVSVVGATADDAT